MITMDRAKEKYKIRMEGKNNKSPYHSITRRDIARAIKRKYFGQERYYKIHEHDINLIISRIMELKAEELFNKGFITINKDFGTIGLYQNKLGDDYNKLPIDWNRTLDLWLDNPKAKAEKKLVRFIADISYIFKWKRGGIKNISYFSFKPTRALRKRLLELLRTNKPIMTLHE